MKFCACLMMAVVTAFGQFDPSKWTYSNSITLNTSASGANVATDQSGFPVLITLGADHPELFQNATQGADLRFVDSRGMELPYQIDTWDAAAKHADIWVRVDTVKGNNAAQTLRMYWGNSAATAKSDGKSVFTTSGGYQAVWHLSPSLEDATANAINGTDSGSTAATGALIGGARSFDNPLPYAKTGQYIALGNPASLNFAGKITLEAWVRWGARDGHRIIVCHGGDAANLETVLRIGESLDYRTGDWTGTSHYAKLTVPPADSNTWTHLAGVYTGTLWSLYRNGVKVASTAADTNGAKINSANWRIGAEFATGLVTRFFHGSLDEIRVSSVAREADWIKLGYENQKPGQTLVKVGPSMPLGDAVKFFRPIHNRDSHLWITQGNSAPFFWNELNDAGRIVIFGLDGKIILTEQLHQ